MNKPYFTKYIPVEGEIKEGDWVIVPHSLGAISQVTKIVPGLEQPIIHYGKRNFTLESLCKKLKLFLCSRDIQVGDKGRSLKFPYVEYLVRDISDAPTEDNDIAMAWGFPSEGKIVWSGEDETYPTTRLWRPLNEVFKVIGEVSPDAMWVKEGMEFEDDDIKQKILTYSRDSSDKPEWFQKFLDKNHKDQYTHFTSYTNDYMDESGYIEVVYELHMKEYLFKCPTCNTFH